MKAAGWLRAWCAWACVIGGALPTRLPLSLGAPSLPPARRLLRRLTLQDASAASHLFTLLMGDKVAPRRALIEEHGSRLALADLDV